MKKEILIKVKDFGEIKVELDRETAPITFDNFVGLIERNYFDNTVFHRIIKGFMIQGGAGNEQLNPIKGEFMANGVKNDLKHTRGVISMARTMVKDSATSQFFIMHEDSPHLDGQYAAFGIVIEGIEVVDRIANEKTNAYDAPLSPVIIESISFI